MICSFSVCYETVVACVRSIWSWMLSRPTDEHNLGILNGRGLEACEWLWKGNFHFLFLLGQKRYCVTTVDVETFMFINYCGVRVMELV